MPPNPAPEIGKDPYAMIVSAEVIGLVLLAALLHATWNALVKTGGDRFAVMALTMASASLFGLVVVPFVPLPAPASWPFLFVSVVLHQFYFATLVLAYGHGDLSQVYPIARGTAPLLIALGAWLVAGESLVLLQVTGLLIVSGGLMSLAWRGKSRVQAERKAISLALLTSLWISLYSICDALGVRRAGVDLAYIAWLIVFSGLPILVVACWRRRGRLSDLTGVYGRLGLGAGLVTALAYGLVIWALGRAPMAHVVTLRETSVLFATVIGALVLKEPFGRRRVTAAVIIVLGTVLLHLGG